MTRPLADDFQAETHQIDLLSLELKHLPVCIRLSSKRLRRRPLNTRMFAKRKSHWPSGDKSPIFQTKHDFFKKITQYNKDLKQ